MSAADIIVMAILLMAALAAMEVFIFAVGGRPSKPHGNEDHREVLASQHSR